MTCVSRRVFVPLVGAFALGSILSACSGSNPDGAVGTSGESDTFVGVDVSTPPFVTVENRTGTSLVTGQVSLVTGGTRPPYFVMLPRIEHGGRRTFPLDSFRTNDGTPFRRNMARARAVKITANDLNGKPHEYEIPFQ